MKLSSTIPLINLLGFTVGLILYALLFIMVRWNSRRQSINSDKLLAENRSTKLLSVAGGLGIVWNLGGLLTIIFSQDNLFLILCYSAFSYAALGFLPAVIVHTAFEAMDATKSRENTRKIKWLIIAAYLMSGVGGIWHFVQFINLQAVPSGTALQFLTYGYLIILAILLILGIGQPIARKTIWITALAVFTISALHLSKPHSHENFWLIELIGHQSSLPLAFVILYQNFRFALADLFLKRALSVLLIVSVVFSFYWIAAFASMPENEILLIADSKFLTAILGLWILTAFISPYLRMFSNWLVNKIILHRPSYNRLRNEIMEQANHIDSTNLLLDEVCSSLLGTLNIGSTSWQQNSNEQIRIHPPFVDVKNNSVQVVIPTTNDPNFTITLGDFNEWRRFLSDEIEVLNDIALITARRIDVLRVTHERCEQELREEELSRLATEAELRTLRAQLNPHFLFNALTTIGYLITSAPDKAITTLVQLTQLLRGVLRSNSEFLTLGEEIKLIQAYLKIEQSRFEERLIVKINVPTQLHSIRVPSLILQPLVENAVKHGITPKKDGGTITITATRKNNYLTLKVIDTGVGVEKTKISQRRLSRVGLNNIEQRLHLYYEGTSSLEIESREGEGTTAQIRIFLPEFNDQKSGKRRNLTTPEIVTI